MRQLRLVLVVCAIAAAGSAAVPAAAPAWTTNGNGGFTLTAPSAKFSITPTMGTTVGVICTVITSSGWVYETGASPVSEVWPKLSGCTAAGLSATVGCGPAAFDPVTSGGGTVTGPVTGFECTVVVPSISCGSTTNPAGGFIISGAFNATYANPSTQQLTTSSSGQSLTATWSGSCVTAFGTPPGTVVFGSNATPPGNLTATVTSSFVPSL